MSNRDKFSSGFWLGTLVGGVVGGIVGATIANNRANRLEDELQNTQLPNEGNEKRPLKSSRRSRSTDRMEIARRSLDDKISDLNNAIDAVRSSVGPVTTTDIDLQPNRTEGEFPLNPQES